ncbi:MAG: lytic transglycosylase domain-containing protein [Robiginitomaculum sp.]
MIFIQSKNQFTNIVSNIFFAPAFIFALVFACPAYADQAPIPHIKPEVAHTSTLLSRADQNTFRRAMHAADRRRWEDVEKYARKVSDSTARKVLLWRQAVADPYVPFSTLREIVQNQANWPRINNIRYKAEVHLFDNPIESSDTVAWFMGQDPVSGEGRAALARAYYKLGNKQMGDQWLKLAWRESRLTRDRQKFLFKHFKDRLTPKDHAARADHLIWLGKRYYRSAGGLLSLMPKKDRALADARMRVGANRSGMDKAINAVPKANRTDTGLLFERARWRRKKKSEIYALPLYLEMTTPPSTPAGQKRLWKEKKYMSYWALKKKRYTDAYKLTLNHGLTSGEGFAEAEFLAGWIALTKLHKPHTASKHFKILRNGVTRPVSLGRASYWQGRAAQDLGNGNERAFYLEASKYPNVYYGQLAAEKLNPNVAMTNLPEETSSWVVDTNFQERDLIRALRMIGEVRSERIFNQFSFHLDDILKDNDELSLLAKIGKDFGYMKASVRAAKQSARFGSMLTESGYPMPELITNLSPSFNVPFVLAIARQESEFNTKATSHAKAYGIMQMIHSTAKRTARLSKLPYQRSWLTRDPEYATQLGAYHLKELLQNYDGSYIMTAAAYNAGERRVNQWLSTYGDPRTGQIDAIDWIESIPFSETRNYVQRVMENLEVYRARMNNNQSQLHLVHDLTLGVNK